MARWLPAGGLTGLYRLYRGTCLAMKLKTSSFSTFSRVWHENFDAILKFRGTNEHGRCDKCEDFAKYMKDALTLQERAEIGAAWDNHLNKTFADRRVYYGISDASTRFFYMFSACAPAIGLILDGMDQAKFKCPRRHANPCEKLCNVACPLYVCACMQARTHACPVAYASAHKDLHTDQHSDLRGIWQRDFHCHMHKRLHMHTCASANFNSRTFCKKTNFP